MEQQNNIQQDNGGKNLLVILDAWQTEDPGESFFSALPAVIQQRAHASRRPVFGIPGLLAHGLISAAAAVLIAAGLWNFRWQAASNDTLVAEAAAWSVEQQSADAAIPMDDVIDAQGAGLDESLGTAVESIFIENQNGYQLLDGLEGDELELLVSELNQGKG